MVWLPVRSRTQFERRRTPAQGRMKRNRRPRVCTTRQQKVEPMTKKATSARRSSAKARTKSGRRWSQRVTKESDALDLKHGVFTHKDPKKIAASLKRSAERSKRRKSDPYRSAMSMLTFYINRAGKGLPASRKKTLDKAKDELRHQFGRP
jgi:hypothetical protein